MSLSLLKYILGLFTLDLSEKWRDLWLSLRTFIILDKEKIYVCRLLVDKTMIIRSYIIIKLISIMNSCLSLKAYVTIIQVLKSQLFVDKFIESVQYTFLDYLAGGFELNFMVAVDFTGAEQYPQTHCTIFWYKHKDRVMEKDTIIL